MQPLSRRPFHSVAGGKALCEDNITIGSTFIPGSGTTFYGWALCLGPKPGER